jgi:hypothetical protein
MAESISNGHDQSRGRTRLCPKSATGGLSNDIEDEDAIGWKSNPTEQLPSCIAVGTCYRSVARMIPTILLSIRNRLSHIRIKRFFVESWAIIWSRCIVINGIDQKGLCTASSLPKDSPRCRIGARKNRSRWLWVSIPLLDMGSEHQERASDISFKRPKFHTAQIGVRATRSSSIPCIAKLLISLESFFSQTVS